MHLSRALIDEVYHYTHYIPNLRGFTREFFALRYPGWDLFGILAVFKAAGVEVKNRPCGMNGKCYWRVGVLHFNSVGDFEVEWNDAIQEDDGKYFWYGVNVPEHLRDEQGPQTHTGAFSIATGGLDLSDPEVSGAVADYAAEQLGTAKKSEKRPARRSARKGPVSRKSRREGSRRTLDRRIRAFRRRFGPGSGAA
jgi:hypothetical protein